MNRSAEETGDDDITSNGTGPNLMSAPGGQRQTNTGYTNKREGDEVIVGHAD